MIKQDFHTHTYYCDGNNSPEEMVLAAIEKGMDALGISGHSYASYDIFCCMSLEDTRKYRDEIAALREKYKDKIDIYCGIEQDFYAPPPEKPYDYMIGSVHWLSDGDGQEYSVDHVPEMLFKLVDERFSGDIYALCEAYFETVSKVVEHTACNIIGHFDLVSKFNEKDAIFDSNNPRYVAAWKAAVDALIPCGVPFEINTGAISRGYRTEAYPSMDMIKYIAKKGGKFILNSDSHSKENLLFGFEDMENKLAKEGIEIIKFTDYLKANG